MILEVKLQIIWFLKLTGWRGSLIFIYSLDESLSDCNERTRFVPKLLALFYLLLLHFPSFTSSSSSLETRTGFSDSGFINYKKRSLFFLKRCLWGRGHVLRWEKRRAWQRSPSIWVAPPPNNSRRRSVIRRTPKNQATNKWYPQEITEGIRLIYKKTLVSSELVLFALALSFLVEIFTCTGKSISI